MQRFDRVCRQILESGDTGDNISKESEILDMFETLIEKLKFTMIGTPTFKIGDNEIPEATVECNTNGVIKQSKVIVKLKQVDVAQAVHIILIDSKTKKQIVLEFVSTAITRSPYDNSDNSFLGRPGVIENIIDKARISATEDFWGRSTMPHPKPAPRVSKPSSYDPLHGRDWDDNGDKYMLPSERRRRSVYRRDGSVDEYENGNL